MIGRFESLVPFKKKAEMPLGFVDSGTNFNDEGFHIPAQNDGLC